MIDSSVEFVHELQSGHVVAVELQVLNDKLVGLSVVDFFRLAKSYLTARRLLATLLQTSVG